MATKDTADAEEAHRVKRCVTIFAFLACLLVAACAARDSSSDRDRDGGFYGGFSAGKGM